MTFRQNKKNEIKKQSKYGRFEALGSWSSLFPSVQMQIRVFKQTADEYSSRSWSSITPNKVVEFNSGMQAIVFGQIYRHGGSHKSTKNTLAPLIRKIGSNVKRVGLTRAGYSGWPPKVQSLQ